VRPSYTFWLCFWLAIVGIVLLYPKFGSREKAHHGGPTDIQGGIKSALGQYQVDIGFYPKSLQDMVQKPSDATNWHGPYFDPPVLPTDPWGDPYIYYCPGKHNQSSYDLLSAGLDGKEGTDDDIGNWQK